MPKSEGLPEHLLAKLRITIPGYELLNTIGVGGQATVYRACELTSGLTVAIKVLHGGPLADEAARERLCRETTALKALNHPNIVCVIESGRTSFGLDYLVMNYVEGRTLDALWKDAAFALVVAPEPAERLRLFKRICEVVQAAHLKGITHRDLSPSNVLVDNQGQPHLLDFGLVTTAFDRMLTPSGQSVSLTGQFLGKLQYAAPEQVRGSRDSVDIRTDVYAMGVMLYQILTNGVLPYEVGGNLADAINNIIYTRPLPPSSVLAKMGPAVAQRPVMRSGPSLVNPTIEAIVLKALEKEKATRYQSAGELAADIDQYLAGRPTTAGPQATAAKRADRTRPWRAIGVSVSAIVLLAIGAISLRRFQRSWQAYAPPPTQVPSTAAPQLSATSPRLSTTGPSSFALAADVSGSSIVPTVQPRPPAAKPSLLARELHGYPVSVGSIAFGPGNRSLRAMAGGDSGPSCTWEIQSGMILSRQDNDPSFGVYSPDGKWLYITGRLISQTDGVIHDLHKIAGARAVFSADSSRLATTGTATSPNIRVFRVTDGATLFQGIPAFPLWRNGGCSLALSDDATRIAAGGGGTGSDKLQVWDVLTGQEMPRPPSNGARIHIAFSHDGTKLLCVHGVFGHVKLYDVQTGKILIEFTTPNFPRGGHCWLLIGRQSLRVARWGDGFNIHYFDVLTTAHVGDFHTRPPMYLDPHFSEDGAKAITADSSGVTIWDTRSFSPVIRYEEPLGLVTATAFSADGKFAAAGDNTGLVRVWQLP